MEPGQLDCRPGTINVVGYCDLSDGPYAILVNRGLVEELNVCACPWLGEVGNARLEEVRKDYYLMQSGEHFWLSLTGDALIMAHCMSLAGAACPGYRKYACVAGRCSVLALMPQCHGGLVNTHYTARPAI
jgi:hypothetical protein